MLGRSHPLLRRLRTLRRERSRRDAEGVLLAEGVHLAQEALNVGAAIEIALVSPLLDDHPEGPALMARLRDADVELREASDAALQSAQEARSAQPVVLLVRRQRFDLETVLDGRPGVFLVVVAHGVQDPGNLGSLVRTADAAGATGFVVAGESADLFHPRTVRATAGSIFRLPAVDLGSDDWLAPMQARRVATLAADSGAGERYDTVDLRGPVALAFGREGSGLPRAVLNAVDGRVRIPMRPGVESLSVGAAAAVLLYEAVRQRGAE